VESLILISLYHFVFEFDMLNNVLLVFVPQALLISVLSVGFFYVMRKVEGLMYGKTMRPPQRAGTGGISAEA
jgi:aminoglycoside phosphotransferase (APT) family kinase protein